MSEQDTTFTETKLTAQTAARMGADELLAALRELRHNPRGPDYWTTLCVCMAALCRAQSAVVVQSRDGLQWTPLATSASPPSWLEEMGVWVAEMGDRAMKQGHAFQPHSHLGYVCLV